jgi:CRISPR-associated DxTHG motif protein
MTFLLCSLGTNSYSDADYVGSNGCTARSRFASAAAARIFDLKGQAGILVSPGVRQRNSTAVTNLSSELSALGIESREIAIPDVAAEDSIRSIFVAIVEAIPEGAEVWLDITYGFRSFGLVAFAALLAARTLKSATLIGVSYGAFDARGSANEPVSIIDLSPVVSQVDWFVALEAVRQTGDLKQLDAQVSITVKPMLRHSEFRRELGVIQRRVKGVSGALSARLPIEFGIQAWGLVTQLETFVSKSWPDYLLGAGIERSFKPLVDLSLASVDGREPQKECLTLDHSEVQRQVAFARFLLDGGEVAGAALVAREALINAQILAEGRSADWLAEPSRTSAESSLFKRTARLRFKGDDGTKSLLRASDEVVGTAWDTLKEIRNKYAHAGARPEVIKPETDVSKLRTLLDNFPEIEPDLAEQSDERVLVSPLGLSAGLLFTVMERIRPTFLILVTSQKARAGGEVALKTWLSQVSAPKTPPFVEWIEIEDPHAGFQEIEGHVERMQAMSNRFYGAECTLNLTGGTSVLQYCADRMARALENVGADFRRVAAVDRRSPNEQHSQPFVVGEIVELRA